MLLLIYRQNRCIELIQWCIFGNVILIIYVARKLVFPHVVFESNILLHLDEKPQVPSRENSLCYSMHVNVKLSLNSRTKTDIPAIRIKMENVSISTSKFKYSPTIFIYFCLMLEMKLCFCPFHHNFSKKFYMVTLRFFWWY